MYKNYLVLFYLIALMEENDFEIVIAPKLHIEMDKLKDELLKTKFDLQKKHCDTEYLKKYNETLLKTIKNLTDENNKITLNNKILINKNNTLQSEIQRLKEKKLLIRSLIPNNNNQEDNCWEHKPILNPQHLFNKSPLYKVQSKLRRRHKDR